MTTPTIENLRARRVLLIGTNNDGKRRELQSLFADLDLTLVTPAERGLTLNPVEDGATFEDNASIKARAFSQASGLPALCDDSGLCVDALGSAPGVHSSRFAGPEKSDAANIARLLDMLEGCPDERRAARFVCVMALAFGDAIAACVRGQWEGRILRSGSGEGGFGYDPVFFVPEAGMTAAEMPAQLKNRGSHRAKAAALMTRELRRLLGY